MSYVIFSDLGSDYSDVMVKKMNIKMIPLSFIMQGEEYTEITKDLMKKTYSLLRDKVDITTSCANTYTIKNKLEEELKKGNDVLYICFSSGLSSTYNNGVEACRELQEEYPNQKAYIVDTLCASLGQGLLLTYACRLRDEGKSIDEVKKFVEDYRLRMSHLFTVDEMYYLYHGGRITKSTYLVAQFAKIKPIMHTTDEGKLEALGKVVGRKKALNTMIDKVCETIEEPEKQIIYISHGDCEDEAIYVRDELAKRLPVKEFFIDYISPIIGVHSGPGTIAIFYFSKHRI